jgi:hypothetical protein
MISVFGSTGNYVGSLMPTPTGIAAINPQAKQVWHGANAARGADRLRYLAAAKST